MKVKWDENRNVANKSQDPGELITTVEQLNYKQKLNYGEIRQIQQLQFIALFLLLFEKNT